jgi:hypothetical protein
MQDNGYQKKYYHKKDVKKSKNLIKQAECKSMIVWASFLPSMVGSGRFSKQVSDMIKFPPYQYSVITGLILSDA